MDLPGPGLSPPQRHESVWGAPSWSTRPKHWLAEQTWGPAGSGALALRVAWGPEQALALQWGRQWEAGLCQFRSQSLSGSSGDYLRHLELIM